MTDSDSWQSRRTPSARLVMLFHFERNFDVLGSDAALRPFDQLHLERLSNVIPRQIFDRGRNRQPVDSGAPGFRWDESPFLLILRKRGISPQGGPFARPNHADEP